MISILTFKPIYTKIRERIIPNGGINMEVYKMVKEVVDNNFSAEVENKKEVVVVDFWASWCGPCKMIAPVIEELSGEYEGKVQFVKLNVDDNPEVSKKYRIASIPTIMVFNNGSVAETMVGFRPKQELKSVIERYV
jgi:thioredoxin 1